MSVFHKCGADYMQQKLEPDYERYVKDRLAKYEEVYSIMAKRDIKEVLAQAAIFWDFELYFEMHELLEFEWAKAEGDRRRALQGLIRAAGMKIHAENNNKKAAISMGGKALADLANYCGELRGFDKLEAILAEIEKTLGTAQSTT
jgi:predicted metal-dependent hydrolase